jgi:hypothetical protein
LDDIQTVALSAPFFIPGSRVSYPSILNEPDIISIVIMICYTGVVKQLMCCDKFVLEWNVGSSKDIL